MGNVRRVYAEKKPPFAVAARALQHEIKHYLGITGVTQVRELIRYDVEHISDSTFETAKITVFSEPPVDDIYEEAFDAKGGRVFLWSICRGSLTSGRILRSSASVC